MAHGRNKASDGAANGHARQAPAIFKAATVQRRLAYAAKNTRDRIAQHERLLVLIRNAERRAKGHTPNGERCHRRGDQNARIRSHTHKLCIGER